MAKQYALAGASGPVFINESTNYDYPLAATVFINTTSGSTPKFIDNLTLMQVGQRSPSIIDLLVSSGLFAGLLAKENPITDRRKFLTAGVSEKKRG